MLCRRWLLVLSLLFSFTRSSVVRADASAGSPPGYTDAITKAIDEFAAGNLPEAREEFRRAHRLFPNARTLRGLGMVEFELRNYSAAVRLLEDALASKVKPLDGDMREDIEGVVERARRYLGEAELEIEPHDATVFVDGVRVDWRPDSALLLEVGEHTVQVRATGWAPEQRTFNVQGGERNSLRIALHPLTAAQERPAAEDAQSTAAPEPGVHVERVDSRPVYKKWWVWTAVGLVASAGIITSVVLVTRDSGATPRAVQGTNTTGVDLQTLVAF